jgi:aminoglycoside phosphotransferase (APT) family kinase protein
MLELNPGNAADYLRRQGWIGPGPVEVEPLSGGVSNAVLRVRTPQRVFVLKQARSQLRTRDAWFSDLDRIWREMEVMQILRPHLPTGVVPEVLSADRANFVFAMSHAPTEAVVWKAQLLLGEVDLAQGERAGRVLGRLHDVTARDRRLIDAFADHTVFVQLRVDPYYRRIQERLPDVAGAVAPLIEELLSRRDALCHGDYSPKNMLLHSRGFMLVDYETAHAGDPTMDLGFFLSHLVLKAVRRSHEASRYFELTRAFWRGYHAEARFAPAADLEARGIGHCAVCLLARIDGTSPVDYLPEEDNRNLVRRLGRALLADRPRCWEDVLRIAKTLLGDEKATEER